MSIRLIDYYFIIMHVFFLSICCLVLVVLYSEIKKIQGVNLQVVGSHLTLVCKITYIYIYINNAFQY